LSAYLTLLLTLQLNQDVGLLEQRSNCFHMSNRKKIELSSVEH